MMGMINHFPDSSVKGARFIGAKYVTAVAALLVFSVVSCQGPSKEPVSALPDPQEEAIRQLADEVMVCLSTQNYRRLEKIIEPSKPLIPGQFVAHTLLGGDFHSAVLDRWDARLIQVDFASDRQATARIDFSYRRTPNRKPVRTAVTLHFRCISGQGNWQLYLP